MAQLSSYYHPPPSILLSSSVIGICLSVGGLVVWNMASISITSIQDSSDLLEDSEMVLLEPESWIGKSFPLLSWVDIGPSLSSGEWQVLLYHQGCPQCTEAFSRYEELALRLELQQSKRRIAAVQLERVDIDDTLTKTSTSLLIGRVRDKREWFVQTPTEFLLEDSKVIGVSTPKLKKAFPDLKRIR